MNPTKNEISKEAIRRLRRMTSQKIAAHIAQVQPMPPSAGRIFTPQPIQEPWTEWRKTTSMWPRKSITGKWIFGWINKRSRPDYRPIKGNQRPARVREFATDKELFHQRLRGEG